MRPRGQDLFVIWRATSLAMTGRSFGLLPVPDSSTKTASMANLRQNYGRHVTQLAILHDERVVYGSTAFFCLYYLFRAAFTMAAVVGTKS